MRTNNDETTSAKPVLRNTALGALQRPFPEKGVAMVEFAISILGLLTLVALIVDGSLLFQRQSLLTESAAELTRQISTEVVRKPIPAGVDGCAELCERAIQLRKTFAQAGHVQGFTFSPSIIAAGSAQLSLYAPYPLIRIDATTEARCLFCSLIPWELNLRSTSLLVIESDSTACNDGDTLPCQ